MITAREAKVELLRRKAQRDMLAFLTYCWWMPSELKIGRHTRALCARLTKAVDDWLEGKSSYLIINMPFRHGKSDLVSRALPAYFLGRAREKQPNVLMSGYGTSLVKGFSGKVQDIVQSEAYQQVFPGMAIDPDKSATDEWKVKGSESTVYAQGLGGSITGKGGNLIIVDDYCKNRQEAESGVTRDTMWNSFKDDFATRTNAPAHIIIVCATRWHQDDIVGRIYAEMAKNPKYARYESLVFPAQKQGEGGWDCLFPELYDKAWYDFQRANLGPYSAAALLDCDPVTSGTMMFRAEWKQCYCGKLDPAKLNVHIFVDGAKAKKATSDFTTMWVIGRGPDGCYYILDGAHARLNLAEKIEELFKLVRRWRVKRVWWEQVGAMCDVEAVKLAMNEQMHHFPIIELHHGTAKDLRIQRLVVPFAKGQIWFPTQMLKQRTDADGRVEVYDMAKEFFDDEYDCYSGPESTPHDDMIDCLADITDEEVMAAFRAPVAIGSGIAGRGDENDWRSEARERRFR